MKNPKTVYLVSALLAIALTITVYFERSKSKAVSTTSTAAPRDQPATASPLQSQASGHGDSEQDAALTVSNFLGGLSPGGNTESAGKERTYVVSYQVAFFRKTPSEKMAEESLTYKQLQERDLEAMPPYLYYGENVAGTFDPTHPETVRVHANIDQKEVKGFIDGAKLWLEPPLRPPASDRYMALKDGTSVYVVPDQSTPSALTLLQGEVVETTGQLDFQGREWVKARFNAKERPRYGFIPSSDIKALTVSAVNPSALNKDEIPTHIRHSNFAVSGSEREKLAANGFYIEPIPPLENLSVDDMADSYHQDPQLFITADLFLHSFHLIFDRMLQDIEEKKLYPAVTKMAANIARTAETELRNAPGSSPELRDALTSDLLYFSVAARVFSPDFVISNLVKPQVEAIAPLVEAGGGELPSAINFLGLAKEDFTQYKVRGHYEKSDPLKRYFRGMMWFGRRSFLLSEKNHTLAAILVPLLVDEAQERRTFEAMDGLITYLVGRQDKYTLEEYRSVNRKVFGTESPGLRQLAANLDEGVSSFQKTVASELPPPRIVSVQTGTGMSQAERLRQTAAFKFLGQRYVLDAFLFNQLTSPSVGSDSNPRNLPSALDVMMLLGSKPARDLQLAAQKEYKWPNYEAQISNLQKVVDNELSKRSTFYEQWLYALKTLFSPTTSRQLFARGEPWQYKNLNAGLGSWSELKHDTILYTEQSAAEMGEGEEFEIPPYGAPGPKGYVEPNPAFFTQVTTAVDQMFEKLKTTGFGTEEYLDKFTLLRELAHRAEAISQKEVSGETISAEDYEWISNIRWAFDRTLLLPRDVDSIRDPSELQMALVADVATDAVQGRVLQEGIGKPQRIVVVVKDISGGTRLTVGYVYSWFEFDSGKRWTDSEWKKIIYSKPETAAAQGIQSPSWYAFFAKPPTEAR